MSTAAPAAAARGPLLPIPSALSPSRWVAALFILAAASLYLAHLASDCALDLAPDEAHYQDRSAHLLRKA